MGCLQGVGWLESTDRSQLYNEGLGAGGGNSSVTIQRIEGQSENHRPQSDFRRL
jgi:hypothetical protein